MSAQSLLSPLRPLSQVIVSAILLSTPLHSQSTHFTDLQTKCDANEANPQAALPACRAILASSEAENSDKVTAWTNLAEIYSTQSQPDQAIQALNAALLLEPKSCNLLMGRGQLHMATGKSAEALQDMTQADIAADHVYCGEAVDNPIEARGDIHFILGDYALAASDYAHTLAGKHIAKKDLPMKLFFAQRHLGNETNSALRSQLDTLENDRKAAAFVGWSAFDGLSRDTLLGQTNREQLLAAADSEDAVINSTRHSKAYFILGEMEAFRGDSASAGADLQLAARFDPFGWGSLAKAEFNRLPTAQQRSSSVGGVTFTPTIAVGRYYALVIGIAKYPGTLELETPVRDAHAIAELLASKYGFQTELLLDDQATRAGIINAIRSYKTKLQPEDNLLIYYAGHGFADKEANKAYWLPVDADSGESANAIISDDLTADVRVQRANHVLIIADSCYSGDMTREPELRVPEKETEDYLNQMRSRTSRTLMASGGDEPVSDRGGNGHSIFAEALLTALNDGDGAAFTAARLFFDRVQQSVGGRAHQLPQYQYLRDSGHDSGDFIFVRK